MPPVGTFSAALWNHLQGNIKIARNMVKFYEVCEIILSLDLITTAIIFNLQRTLLYTFDLIH